MNQHLGDHQSLLVLHEWLANECRRMFARHLDIRDLQQAGAVGLMKAAETFNPSTRRRSLACLRDCMAPTDTPAPVSAPPSFSALPGVMAGSGASQNPEGRISASRSPSDETTERRRHILIVEDNKADAWLIREALERASVSAELHEVDDGEKAIRFFENVDADPDVACPDLILLDINMPRYKGGVILRHLRASRRCKKALVLVVTSSDSERDRGEMAGLGANGYFRKPSELAEFMKLGQLVQELRALSDDPSGSGV